MPKQFNSPFLAPWVNERLNRVLGGAVELERMNGASPFELDANGQPVVGLRPGYGRGGTPPAGQIGAALGALARNWMYTNAAKDDAIDRRPTNVKRYPDHDKFYHCQGNCEATKAGPFGRVTAAVGSDYAKEVFDLATGGAVDEADRAANRRGREVGLAGGQCYEGCQHLDQEWVVAPQKHRH